MNKIIIYTITGLIILPLIFASMNENININEVTYSNDVFNINISTNLLDNYKIKSHIYSKNLNLQSYNIENVLFDNKNNIYRLDYNISFFPERDYKIGLEIYNDDNLIYFNKSIFEISIQSDNDFDIFLESKEYNDYYLTLKFDYYLKNYTLITFSGIEYKIINNKLVLNYSEIFNEKILFEYLVYKTNDDFSFRYNIDLPILINFSKIDKPTIKSVNYLEQTNYDEFGYYNNLTFISKIEPQNFENNQTYYLNYELYNEYDQFIMNNSMTLILLNQSSHNITINGSKIFNSEKDGRYILRNISLYDMNSNLLYRLNSSSYSKEISYLEFIDWNLPEININVDDTKINLKKNEFDSSGGGGGGGGGISINSNNLNLVSNENISNSDLINESKSRYLNLTDDTNNTFSKDWVTVENNSLENQSIEIKKISNELDTKLLLSGGVGILVIIIIFIVVPK
jgi:hypothetical protein